MPARDMTRWDRNPDGTYSRKGKYMNPEEVEAHYDAMTKPELEAELEARGLPKTGNKAELIERLQEG